MTVTTEEMQAIVDALNMAMLPWNYHMPVGREFNDDKVTIQEKIDELQTLIDEA